MERGGDTKAPLTGCSIVKRGESSLSSQLPIIPHGIGDQTSCGVQLQSTDSPDFHPPLHEILLEPKHKIFLSHSGAQKSFVKQLCKDIERYDRYPFFDVHRTSLSIGCHFPSAIFEAIGQCQVAVVVLSEEFFSRTKWPMLELSALVKRKRHDSGLVLMPVFLGLTREQCRDRKNQDRWFLLWQRWATKDRRIILEDWMAVFQVFGYINSVSLFGSDEVKCREDIVDAVCKEVPAETRRDDSRVRGRSRLCKTIDEKVKGMELSKCYKVRILGLYGVGGIGKSTACMTLCNYYFEDFQGRVCHVQFGDKDGLDELHILQEILKRLTNTNIEQIDKLNKDECKNRMKDIKNQKIVLAMDNVFESHEIVERAKLILRAGFAKGSILIVTARSLDELLNLNLEKSECMEMPELTLDDAKSLFIQEVGCDKSTDECLIQQCVDRCYFHKGDGTSSHYHPLALRVLGGQLGSDPSQWVEKLKKIDIFNQYREKDAKHPIFSILRRSFDVLMDEDQVLFMDAILFGIHGFGYLDIYDIYWWLSMIHGKNIQSELNGLKRKSLIQSLNEKNIGIHDLWREFCVNKTKVGELKSRHWIYEKWSDSHDESIAKPSLSVDVWNEVKKISIQGPLRGTWDVTLNLSCCSSLVALILKDVAIEGNALDLRATYNLKSLQVRTKATCIVHGLGLLKHLCLLEWSTKLPTNLEFIEDIRGLTNLQFLNLEDEHGSNLKVPNLSKLSLLQGVALCNLLKGNSITCTSTMKNLRHLCFRNCDSLQRCNGVGDLFALEELVIFSCQNLKELPNLQGLKNLKKLDISGCRNLKELPNLQGLKNLKRLDISDCSSIQALLGVGDLTTLLELCACECTNLGQLPNLNNLINLQVLNVGFCPSIKVVKGLSALINLQECMISINRMGESIDLHRLTQLRRLSVQGWSLEGSTIVGSLVNLEHLSINSCEGVDIFNGPSNASRLCRIELSNCKFKDVACLSDFTRLQEVCIINCPLLERFPNMHGVTRLDTLRISHCKNLREWEDSNRIRAISFEGDGVHLGSGSTFPNLLELQLEYLAIMELPDLSAFPKLYRLSIVHCPKLVKLTSSEPLIRLKYFRIFACKSLPTILIENLKTMYPGILAIK